MALLRFGPLFSLCFCLFWAVFCDEPFYTIKCVMTLQIFAHFTSIALLSRPLSFRLLWNELKTQLVQHLALASPAGYRALLTRVFHRTWIGSRWLFEKIGAPWARMVKACVAAEDVFFFRVAQNSDLDISHRADQRHSAKTRHLTRHLTLHGTFHTHRQHLDSHSGNLFDPRMSSTAHFCFAIIPKWTFVLRCFLSVPQVLENNVYTLKESHFEK